MDKKNNKILLTISILVSNRKDTIRRTMESIRPLLERVPSECIIIDTGSTDGSIDIAREYTDTIIPFNWCDDFSAARNQGLKRARGDWFLYLDDDEWFDDVSEIVKFFVTGEYKRYNSASYKQRNYYDMQGAKYTDANVFRAVKIEKETSVVGAIHERLEPVYEPIAQWNAYVHHYGYVYSTPEEEQKKHKRNVSILLRELQKQPANIRYHAQLAQEYGAIKDYEKGISICRNALQKYTDQWKNPFMNWIMWALVRMLDSNGEYVAAWEEGWQILNTCNPSELVQAHISYFMMRTTKNQPQDAEQLLKLAETYFSCMDYLISHQQEILKQQVLTMTFEEALPFQWSVAIAGIAASCQTGSFEKIPYFLIRIQWHAKASVPQIMEDYKRKFPQAQDALTEALSKLTEQNAYISLQRLIVGAKQADANLQTLFDECVEQCYLERVYYPQALATGVKHKLDFIEMFAILDQEDWENWVYAAGGMFTTEDYIGLGQIVEKALSQKNHIQYTAFLLIVQKYMILQESALNDPDFLLDLEQFCDNAQHYFSLTYQQTMFRPENQLNLPRMCRFAMRMNDAFAARKEGNLKGCIVSLREALAENPSMKDVVEGALQLLEEEVEQAKKRDTMEHMRNEEFILLAKQIKTRVKQLIEEKAKIEALQVIEQLEMLLPGDDEVKQLKEIAKALPDGE